MYQLTKKIKQTALDIIIRTNPDGTKSYVPADPRNSDYHAYQAWLAEGNKPTPAES